MRIEISAPSAIKTQVFRRKPAKIEKHEVLAGYKDKGRNFLWLNTFTLVDTKSLTKTKKLPQRIKKYFRGYAAWKKEINKAVASIPRNRFPSYFPERKSNRWKKLELTNQILMGNEDDFSGGLRILKTQDETARIIYVRNHALQELFWLLSTTKGCLVKGLYEMKEKGIVLLTDATNKVLAGIMPADL